MFWQEGINNYFQSLAALEIVPICKGKACGDRCDRYGVCNTVGTRVLCDWGIVPVELGCKRGEPFGMLFFYYDDIA